MNEGDAPRGLESRGVTWARVRLAQRLGRAAIAAAAVGLFAGTAARGVDAYAVGQLASSGLFLVALALLVWSFIVWFRRASWPGAITIDAHGIDVRRGGVTRRIPRSRITSAYALTRYVRGDFVPTVEIEIEGGDVISFEVLPGDVAARAVVDDLGFGRGKRRMRIALGSPARRLYHLLMALVAYYAGSIAAAPLLFIGSEEVWHVLLSAVVAPVVMVLAYAFLRSVLRAPEVTIGDDGVLYRSGRKQRFLAGASITSVDQPSVALPLLLRSSAGNPIAIHGSALDLERRSAVAHLAHERFIGPAGPADQRAAQFARGGRTVTEWREHLRARGGDTGYREAASPADVAAAVLRSPRSTSEERVGAALALRVAGEPEERIRIAASAAAHDGLRVALETIAEAGDDVVLEKALRRL